MVKYRYDNESKTTEVKQTDLSKMFPEIRLFGNLWRLPAELFNATVEKFDSWTESMTYGRAKYLNQWNNSEGKTWSEYKKDKPYKSMALGNMQDSISSSYKTFQKKWYLGPMAYVAATLVCAYAGGLAAAHGGAPTLGQMTSLPSIPGESFLGVIGNGLKFVGGAIGGGYLGLLGSVVAGFATTTIAAATASITKSTFFNSIVTFRRNNYLKGIEKETLAAQKAPEAPAQAPTGTTATAAPAFKQAGTAPVVAAPSAAAATVTADTKGPKA